MLFFLKFYKFILAWMEAPRKQAELEYKEYYYLQYKCKPSSWVMSQRPFTKNDLKSTLRIAFIVCISLFLIVSISIILIVTNLFLWVFLISLLFLLIYVLYFIFF